MQNGITVKGFNLLPQMNADEDRWVSTYLSKYLSISNVNDSVNYNTNSKPTNKI